MRSRTIVAVLCSLALILMACDAADEVAVGGDGDAAADSGTDGTDPGGDANADGQRETLRWGNFSGDAGSLDPHFASAGSDRIIVDVIFNGLVRFPPGDITGDFEPDLAVEIPEPEEADDGRQTWTFTLREGVMCHPGPETDAYELTASDVVYSLERAADAERSAYSSDYSNFAEVEALDEYTVRITLESPRSSTLFLPAVADYSGGFIVCEQAAEALGDEGFANHPVGTGPFMFEQYNPGDSVALVANDDYFRGQPKLAGIDVRYLPDDSSREVALSSGEVDGIYGVHERAWVDRLDAQEGIRAHWMGMLGNQWLHFKVDEPPFDDVRVRQAVAYSVDRAEHVALSGEGLAEPSYGFIVDELLPGGLSQEDVQELDLEFAHDPDRARELLAEAGYADGFSFDVTTSEMGLYRNNYEVLQAALSNIGVTMNIDVVEHSTMHSVIREGANPITFYSAWRPNSDVFLYRFAHSDTIVVGGANPDTNFSFYDGIDDLVDEARDEVDPDRQADLWQQANIKLLEDMAIYPLYVGNQAYAHVDGLDYGHETVAVLATYPQFTELTTLSR